MGAALKILVAAAILGGTFGSATATVESIDEGIMVVTIEVEVLDPGGSVVAHLSFDEERLTFPLLAKADGIYGIQTELEPKNYTVVFETVEAGGESSEPTTLARMGADLGPDSKATTSTTEEEGLSDEAERMLWLAIGLGAASLSLLAFWVLGGRDEEETAQVSASESGSEEE